ncbi:hypothetical protein RISK_001089 [Rhodopirellula islandica]|uniref:Signal peptide and transmembrane protein n=1 Tax=Rhodopirellula islandica TaxID=595434 RepID=A0A0J1BJP0_RHOIS|nr:hypothetical protein [Rhodopirellula islandica]KLU06775.1 hypothetical protein RISK_001089 [Rhodopirellula islandica]
MHEITNWIGNASWLAARTLGVLLLACAVSNAAESSAADIQYIVLEGGGPDQGPGRDVEANVRSMARRFDPMPASSKRMVAYGVQQLRILSRSSDVIRKDVEQALDLAERTGIPVFLHLDSCYGWGADDTLPAGDQPAALFWQHPEMREWDRFPVGDELPDRIPRPWFNWGPWCSPAPAIPAFGSPALADFASSQLDEGVLSPLVARLKRWRSENREHLFAGINVAWEAHLPDFSDPLLQHLIDRENGVVRAEAPRSAKGIEMDRSFLGKQLGNASLHWRGWDEERLVKAAKQEGISRDEKFRQLCYLAIHDYMETLARTCHERGLPSDRVYTHIVALATVKPASTTRPPIWTAVNPYSTPGFTMDNQGGAKFNLQKLIQQIRQASQTEPVRFGVVESYFRLGDRIYFDDADQCRRELEELFAAGANLQAFYGGFPLTHRTPEAALQAIETWLVSE